MELSCLLILLSKLVSFPHLVGASLGHNRLAQFLQPYGYLPCPMHYVLCPMAQLEFIKKLKLVSSQNLNACTTNLFVRLCVAFTSQRKNCKEVVFPTYTSHVVLKGKQSSTWPRTGSRSSSLHSYLIVAS